jgi:glucose/arabinose dehydrogenase
MRVAPNGDIFVAETGAGRIRILRGASGDSKSISEIFASELNQPFGITFFPSGDKPQWVYVANTDSVIRFSYALGDTKASGKPEVIVAGLPSGGHSTRNLIFTNDNKRMLVSVGSRSNAAEGVGNLIGTLQSWWGGTYPLGASLGTETDRAAILTFDPDGKRLGVFATGIRNCVGLAVRPLTGDLYCSTSERTVWETTWCRTILHGCVKVRSMDGPGLTSVTIKIRDILEGVAT